MEFDGRVYPNCPSSSNPYHECTSKCLENLISGGGIRQQKILGNTGLKTPDRIAPMSPHRADGNKSPRPSYYRKNTVEADDDKPSFSSADENSGFFWRQTMPDSANRMPDHSNGGTSIDLCSRPRTPDGRPRVPESRPRTPSRMVAIDSRPRTPERVPNRPRTPETRPTTPDHRPRTPEHRPTTPEHMSRMPDRPRTPDHRPRTPDHRPRTPEHMSRMPDRPRTPDHRPRTPRSNYDVPDPFVTAQAWSPVTKTYGEDMYLPEEEDDIFLNIIAQSPVPKPITRPAKPEHHLIQERRNEINMESDDCDCFSFVEDQSTCLFPEIVSSSKAKPASASSNTLLSYSDKEEENQSVSSESNVSVGEYKVRSSVSSTLTSILDKHGDIAAGSKLQCLSTRSYYLESLSLIVLELKSINLKDLTMSRVDEMLTKVKDMASVKIEVAWLLETLNEISDAVKHFNRHDAVVKESEGCDRDLEAARKDAELVMKELDVKQKELKICREEVNGIGAQLCRLEMQRSRLSKNSQFFKSKVEKFQGESVLDKLL